MHECRLLSYFESHRCAKSAKLYGKISVPQPQGKEPRFIRIKKAVVSKRHYLSKAKGSNFRDVFVAENTVLVDLYTSPAG
jgi:hypothetical protein